MGPSEVLDCLEERGETGDCEGHIENFENREQSGRCILSIACKTLGTLKERRHGFEEDEIVRLAATSGTLEVSRIIYQMKYFEQRWDRTYKLHEELWKRTVANGMHQIRKSVRIIQVT